MSFFLTALKNYFEIEDETWSYVETSQGDSIRL